MRKSLVLNSHMHSLGLDYTTSLLVFAQKHLRSAKSLSQKVEGSVIMGESKYGKFFSYINTSDYLILLENLKTVYTEEVFFHKWWFLVSKQWIYWLRQSCGHSTPPLVLQWVALNSLTGGGSRGNKIHWCTSQSQSQIHTPSVTSLSMSLVQHTTLHHITDSHLWSKWVMLKKRRAMPSVAWTNVI